MSNVEEVESAEAKMNAAKGALLAYLERRKSIDRDQHRRLLARLKRAEEEFMKVVSALDR
jgi:hypothetical protein